MELKDILSEEVQELRVEVERLKDTIEAVDVELIRSKQETKRVKKEIEKLKSLNLSRINIDFSERDKLRIGRNKSRIILLRLLTRIINSSSDGKYLLHDMSGENHVKIIKLNKNVSKESNCDILWESIRQSSQNSADWDAIFNNQ